MTVNQTGGIGVDWPALMTPSEVAAKFRVVPETITKMARLGEFEGAFQVRRVWRIPRDSVLAMMRIGVSA